ncbi:MAG: undecaprenyl-diphosphate phosphatase [Thermoanaerobaculia bacterium]|nr:undecaprenyl-diphosphate phosphatase [Thermoanaerobaculia bacterium]
MTWLQATILALVQGVTEFLPISSSAHLVLTSRWLGWEDQGLTFDMAVHAGSLVAICAVVRGELGAVVRAVATPRRRSPERRLAVALVVATIPVAVVGLLGAGWVERSLRQEWVIGLTSILFGLLLGWADRRAGTTAVALEDLSWKAIVLIGLAQAVAVVPGTSRSGVTMTAALALGLSRPGAARLSFLLAVPVMALVALKSALDVAVRPVGAAAPHLVAVGFVVAGVAAYAAARWLLGWLERADMRPFVAYRVILGVGILVWCWL